MSNKSKLLNKLRKLKALADDKAGNVNETATAAALYAQLLAEHQLEESEIPGEDSDGEIKGDDFLPADRKRLILWRKVLINFLAHASGCEMVLRLFKKGDKNTRESVMVIGPGDQVAAVHYLYKVFSKAVLECCEKWREELRNPPFPKGGFRVEWRGADGQVQFGTTTEQGRAQGREATLEERNKFCLGCADAVGKRAVDAYRNRLARARVAGRSLVHVDKTADLIEEFLQKLGTMEETKTVEAPADHEAFRAGERAGAAIPLHTDSSALGGEKTALAR